MKIAGPDVILFVIGFVLFAGAGYGLYVTKPEVGADGSASGLFRVDYDARIVEIGEQPAADLGGTNEFNFVVAEVDVTKVFVDVACTGGTANLPYFVVVRVQGPGGLEGEADGTCDGVRVEVEIGRIPESETVEGSDEAAAHENAGEHANATAAVGEWVVTVSGSRGVGGVALPTTPGPAGTVAMSVEKWVHRFTPVAPP